MPTNDELKRLRAMVRKRRNDVTAKENRIKRRTGVDIRNTQQDPRRPVNVVEKYNKRQLLSYFQELDSFMSRGNGFVAGAGNSAIPKQLWMEYKRLESRYNSIGAMQFKEISNIFIPTAGMTIAQRDATIIPDKLSAQGAIVNRPYSVLDRRPNNVKDAQALQKLVKDMRRKVSEKFLPEKIKEGRKQLNDMLTTIGNNELKAKANSLTDAQFNVLWNYTNFATNVSGIYFQMQNKAAGSTDKWYSSVVEDWSSDIRELFDWAGTLSTTQESSAGRQARSPRKSPRKG